VKFFRRRRREEELDEEIRSHLRMAVRDRVERGETQEQAEAAALREFGNVGLVKEVTRGMWGWRRLGEWARDARFGLRMLRREPAFTAVAVLTLALGVGVNTAIFSLVNAVLLRPLPFPQSDELMVFNVENGKSGETFPSVSPADFFDWKAQSRSFSDFAAYTGGSITLLEADRAEEIPATRVTQDFFKTLQVQPALGRPFRPEEFKDGSNNVVILSQRLWRRRFGGDPGIVGKTLKVEQGSITVAGVMPPDFKLPSAAEAWTPLAEDSSEMRLRAARYYQAVARLKPGVARGQAEAEMRTIASRLAAEYPDSDSNWSVRLVSLRETLVGDARPALLILFGAVGLVLLIACANVANLMLARATARHREVAIRAALGASRWRIVRQLVVESVLLSCLGGALGVFLAQWSVGAILWLLPKELRFPRVEEAHVDLAVLGFAFAVALLTGVVLGLIPGLKASRGGFHEALKESGRGASAGRRLRRARGAVVVAEIALTLVLLAGAGLLIRSFERLRRVELGFNAERVLVFPISTSMAKYAQPEARAAYFERLAEQAQSVPGVESVARASCPPLMYTMFFPFSVEGHAKPNEVPQAWFNSVGPNYFELMGIGLLEGRGFTDEDRAGTTNAAVINETMRRRYFAGEDPLGKHLTINYLNTPLTVEVVGVARDIKQESLAAQPNAQIYVADPQVPWFSTALVVRARGDANAMLPSVERAVRAFDPAQSGSGAKTMGQLLSDSAAQPRFYSLLLGCFAGLALLLAAVGVYGLISYAVAQRTHEIGIRVALGARGGDVLRLVVGEAMLLVLFGIVAGLGAAFALTRLMKSLLYEVGATDPATFAGVTALLACVALAACVIPARRAMRVDPVIALRCE
jgi:putative ABC transport system permease protein